MPSEHEAQNKNPKTTKKKKKKKKTLMLKCPFLTPQMQDLICRGGEEALPRATPNVFIVLTVLISGHSRKNSHS
jgi:hypothetical protein